MKTKQQKPRRQRRTSSEQRTQRRNLLRKAFSLILLIFCTIPMLGGGLQPIWVIPAAICICMNEDLYFCMAAGVIAGFGIDLACDSILGVNAMYMVILCTAVCLLFAQILRRSFVHYFILTAAGVFLHSALRYLLTVGIFRAEGKEMFWNSILLPSALLTLAAALLVYLLYLPLTRLLTKRVRSMDAAAIRRDF